MTDLELAAALGLSPEQVAEASSIASIIQSIKQKQADARVSLQLVAQTCGIELSRLVGVLRGSRDDMSSDELRSVLTTIEAASRDIQG